ncbi:GGDEF domain-containing protein [Pseudomarimonas arenosa]|uniref:diguanylate cyclase n=1 Tax=Pseudomarimonas arenosa TaxID=2774145 RepID=A0AAW3ZF11_9GAMM|nr:GGDEF domain-containing protein [Pseudomarimonas arenosa]MBD8524239.1 GGDEF domain-containing protein [Pseudomarimonas arenosa]
MTLLNPRQAFYARLARLVLAVGAITGFAVAGWHARTAAPHPLDHVVPLSLALISLFGLIYLHWLPRRARWLMMWLSLALACVLAGSTLVFVVDAWNTGIRLVETLPASAVAMLCLLIMQLVFLPPRTVIWLGLLTWAPVALPVMGYLLLHSDELTTRRGQELMVLLGPASLMAFVLVPFRAATERRLVQLQRSELRSRVLASRDPLTDLSNRRAFEMQLANVIAQRAGPQQLILLDVDHFKSINDRFGHPAGDQVLVEVARRCASLLQRGELLARWGGEEFAALCREPEHEPLALAEAMRGRLEATPIGDVGIVTASFGVTRVRSDDDLQSALQRADQALYRAKQGGRNRCESG